MLIMLWGIRKQSNDSHSTKWDSHRSDHMLQFLSKQDTDNLFKTGSKMFIATRSGQDNSHNVLTPCTNKQNK